MSMVDLTGRWMGLYTYATGQESVPFEVELWQTGTTLEGRMIEPNTFRPDAGSELSAQIFGWVDTETVGFSKRYSGLPKNEHPKYQGRVLRNGQRVEGTWHFAKAAWVRGSFSMIRKPRATARAAQTAEADA